MTIEDEKPTSSHSDAGDTVRGDKRDQENSDGIALPSHVVDSGTLDRLVDTARDYAKASTAENTTKAYAGDWKHFTRWCRLKGTDHLPPSPEMVGLYLADLATPSDGTPSMVAAFDARCF